MKKQESLLKSGANFFPAQKQSQDEAGWEDLIQRLLGCVQRDRHGKIIGIDANARRNVIQDALVEDENKCKIYPDYIVKKDAGNLVITTDLDAMGCSMTVNWGLVTKLEHYEYDPDLKILMETGVIQNVRYDLNGNMIGRSLFGGFAPIENNDRKHAAITNTVTKLTLMTEDREPENRKPDPVAKQMFIDIANNGAIEIANNVLDIPYLTKFLPTDAYIKQLAREKKLDPEVVQFYSELLHSPNANDLRHMMHDPSTLKLAISNTYHLALDRTQSLTVKQKLDDTTQTKVGYLLYQTETNALLASLYPQDWVYVHEFYIGLLSVVSTLLEHNPERLERALIAATTNIIDRLLESIIQGTALNGTLSELPPHVAYEYLKAQTEINLMRFMTDYPGIDQVMMSRVLGVAPARLYNLNESLQNTWRIRQDDILNAIIMHSSTAHQKTDFSAHEKSTGSTPALTSSVNTGSALPPPSANTQIERAQKEQAMAALFEDVVYFIPYSGKVLIAHDGHLYSEFTYNKMKKNDVVISMYTDENLNQHALFDYVALHDLIALYENTPNDPTTQINVLKQLGLVCCDMRTGNMMISPMIILLETTGPEKYKPLICDVSTYEQILREKKEKVLYHCDFSLLKNVIDLMRTEIEANIDNNYNRQKAPNAITLHTGNNSLSNSEHNNAHLRVSQAPIERTPPIERLFNR